MMTFEFVSEVVVRSKLPIIIKIIKPLQIVELVEIVEIVVFCSLWLASPTC